MSETNLSILSLQFCCQKHPKIICHFILKSEIGIQLLLSFEKKKIFLPSIYHQFLQTIYEQFLYNLVVKNILKLFACIHPKVPWQRSI
jgi:hypothetical protein